MPIIYRSEKGQDLLPEEVDDNFRQLEEIPDGKIFPKTKGVGIQIDRADPDFGWKDIVGTSKGGLSTSPPSSEVYQGGIRQYRFEVGDDIVYDYHLPHDYAPDTDIFIHTHWSHNNSDVTAGSVTWQIEAMYAKGFNQSFFLTPILVNIVASASTIRYQHMTSEIQLSAPGGVGGLLDTNLLEVDGILIVKVVLTANTMDNLAKPFLHTTDIHYQSTGIPTKNKAPDFWT
jgi:hypothetical protein